ncbi:MAG: amidohydrolase family protein [Desulfobacterales bacterium]|jgi:imidazolonepropionase-like amidohydrolase
MRTSVSRHLKLIVGWVVDGSGGPILRDRMVSCENGRISAVRPTENKDHQDPHTADFSGHTLIPGLVDSHVHLTMSGTNDEAVRARQLNETFSNLAPVIGGHLTQHRRWGVAAVRDGGDYGGHVLRYRHEGHRSASLAVRVRSPGKAWRQINRYGRLIGRPPFNGCSLAEAIARCKEPSDHVKIVNSGLNSLTVFGRQTAPQFSIAVLKEAVQAAKDRHLRVMVHANGEIPVGSAVEAGCHSVEHGYFMGRANLERMAERQTVWVPTLMPMKAYAEERRMAGIEADVCLQNLEHQLCQVRQGHRIGVPIALGTDAGSIGVHHGEGILGEMSLLAEAGLSLPEVVQAATRAGAALAGMDDLGIIGKGFSATFLIVAGPPEDLPKSLSAIRFHVVGGQTLTV